MTGRLRRSVWTAAIFLAVIASPVFGQVVPEPASATQQAPSPPPKATGTPASTRGFISLGGSYHATTNSFGDGAVKKVNAEDAAYDTSYEVKSGMGIDVSAGVTLWRRLGVRVGYGRFSLDTPARFQASVPHPFFFDKARGISHDISGLRREESSLDLHLAGIFPVGRRTVVAVFAGPSMLYVKQGVVTDYTYTDAYPYDTAAFGKAATADSWDSKIGIGGGANLGFFLTKAVGLGVGVQYAQADVPLAAAGGATKAVRAGGVKATFGLAVRF